MTATDLRNKLSRFILDSSAAKGKKGSVLICIGPKWYEIGKVYFNKDTGEVFIDAGRKVRDDATPQR